MKRRIFLYFAVVFAVLVLAMPRTNTLSYDYRKGSPWKYDNLIAQFDFPILKSEEQILEESSSLTSCVIPYYRYSEDVVKNNLRKAEALDMTEHSQLGPTVVSSLKRIYAKGVVSDEGLRLDKKITNKADALCYVQKDKRAEKVPASEIYTISSARLALLSRVESAIPSVNADSLLKKYGVYDLVSANLTFDAQTTELVHANSPAYVSPTDGYVSAGQLIVSEGEIVTSEIAQMLDSYRKEYEQNIGYNKPRFLMWGGNMLVAFALVGLLFFAIYFTTPEVLRTRNSLLYILCIFLMASVGMIFAAKMPGLMMYMVPFTLVALYLQAFFPNRVIISVYIVSLLPLLLFTQAGVPFFMMFLSAGLVNIYAFNHFRKGWKQFIMAGITFMVLFGVFLGFWLIGDVEANPLRVALYLLISSLLAVAGYPLIYLFERVFDLVSGARLVDMCDTSSGILRELEQKAPGTFQHSLQVMNMADAAARAIDANTLLVRAGALYHDIGKMKNPLCFVENSSLVTDGSRYHEALTPLQSARDIMRHVADGMDIADREKLPQIVRSFIQTHHGTTLVSYFYSKHISSGGDPSIAEDFRYNGVKPSTKEQVILMLCDSLEAASRTLDDYSPESFDRFVEKIVSKKMDEGQFQDADISLRELMLVKNSIKTYLAQMYHERIVYPSDSNTNSNKKS